VHRLVVALLLVACTRTGDDQLFPPRDAGPFVARRPFYYEDVAPIIQHHCLPCHSGKSVGPVSLANLFGARQNDANIYRMVSTHQMPPFYQPTDQSCGVFRSPTPITEADKQTLIDWFDNGSQVGDSRNAPAPLPPLVRLTNPTVTLDPGPPYTPAIVDPDDWHCYVVDPGLTSDAFITAWDVVAGDKGTVQEVQLFQLGSDAAAATAVALDAADPTTGYGCFGGTGTGGDDAIVAAWRADQGMTQLDPGTGIRLHAGRKMVMQVHYVIENGIHADTSRMLLLLAPSVAHETTPLVVSDRTLSLPPGLAQVHASVSVTLPQDAVLSGIIPHLGERGLSIHANLHSAGNDSCVSDIAYWNPDWTSLYLLGAPVALHAGDVITIGCTYDTTMESAPVGYGETADDDMCQATLLLTP
jgi:hypothetical protein